MYNLKRKTQSTEITNLPKDKENQARFLPFFFVVPARRRAFVLKKSMSHIIH